MRLATLPSSSAKPCDDTALIKAAQQGDRAAFNRLLEAYYDIIHRFAFRLTGFAADADDLTQDVCVALASRIGSYRHQGSFQGWLYRLTLNACRDQWRKAKFRSDNAQAYSDLERHLRAGSAEDARRAAWLYRAIARLEEPLRVTALLVLAEDMSHAEVGQILGCAESTISWRMHEVKKHLRDRLEAGYD